MFNFYLFFVFQINHQHATQQNHPVDVYLLHQYNPVEKSDQTIQLVPTAATHILNNYYATPLYNIQTHQLNQNEQNNEKTEEKQQYKITEDGDDVLTTPIVQVFKDANCSKDVTDIEEYDSSHEKPNDYIDPTNFNVKEVSGNFGKKINNSINYKGRVHYTVETPKAADRSERFYFSTAITPLRTNSANVAQDGIDKLVASTQDLISNEDLLIINRAAEKYVNDPSEDFIKPRPRYRQKTDSDHVDTKQITVQTKFRSPKDDKNANRNDFNFATPIIVPDSTYSIQKQQILNNLLSTVVPYIENGYELVGVRNSFEENVTDAYNNVVNVTPRPIGPNYLAPITVALRLLNANVNNTLEVGDHEASDSELVSDTVENPKKETTIVEIQESIPVDITHINDVEVHEYLDEGRSNDVPYNFAKSLYYKYLDALRSSRKIQDNMNKMLYKYGVANDENFEKVPYQNDTQDLNQDSNSSEDGTENEPEQSGSQRTEYIGYLNKIGDPDQKIIQPIIIEKEVPITQFVDRFIEKEVRVPQTVEVSVPVDRPVPVPVSVEKIVEKPVEVTKFVNKPYPVRVPQPYPVEVPYPIEKTVFVDRPVGVPFPVEKVVEKPVLHPVPVPTPVGIPVQVQVPLEHIYPIAVEKPVPYRVEVEKPVHIDHIIEKQIHIPYPVEKQVHIPVPYEKKVPVPYPVEKKVHVPVEKIVEKPVTVTKYIEKPVHVKVPVPQPVPVPVRVPQPYPVDRIVEKRVPYPVDRIVEKQVPVQIPIPVEKIVEKIIEKPVMVTKYVDKPYPVERIVEKRVPYPVKVPVEVKVPYPVEKIVEKPVHIPIALYQMYAGQESKYYPQYAPLNQNYATKTEEPVVTQHQQYIKDKQTLNDQITNANHYATSYQYVNNTLKINDQNKLNNIINYLRNAQNYLNNQSQNKKLNNYQNIYGSKNPYDSSNKNYVLEVKVRRADREPKMTNLRIEYGGFKPPLIPSTEVDLDGIPVDSKEQ